MPGNPRRGLADCHFSFFLQTLHASRSPQGCVRVNSVRPWDSERSDAFEFCWVLLTCVSSSLLSCIRPRGVFNRCAGSLGASCRLLRLNQYFACVTFKFFCGRCFGGASTSQASQSRRIARGSRMLCHDRREQTPYVVARTSSTIMLCDCGRPRWASGSVFDSLAPCSSFRFVRLCSPSQVFDLSVATVWASLAKCAVARHSRVCRVAVSCLSKDFGGVARQKQLTGRIAIKAILDKADRDEVPDHTG